MLRSWRSASTLAATSVGLALQEELPEQAVGAAFGGERGAAAGEAERLIVLAAHREHERGIAGLVADPLGGELVERDPVAEAAALWMRRAGEEALLGRVGPGDARMADAGEDGQVLANAGELLQIGRQLIIAAGAAGEEELRQDAHVGFDGHHAARDGGRRRGKAKGLQRFEQGQSQRHARAAQKRSPRPSR